MKTRQFENANVGQVRQAYCRPETWSVPCDVRPLMDPSIHSKGSNWMDGGEHNLNDWAIPGGGAGSPSGGFQLKSVWDATAKELQNGEIVTVPID